jgi:hypothetical protein
LYDILKRVVGERRPITYAELSTQYRPLGEINARLARRELPPISAVVVLAGEDQVPGGGFWGCCEGVPPRPPDGENRKAVHTQILTKVFDHPRWPLALP